MIHKRMTAPNLLKKRTMSSKDPADTRSHLMTYSWHRCLIGISNKLSKRYKRRIKSSSKIMSMPTASLWIVPKSKRRKRLFLEELRLTSENYL